MTTVIVHSWTPQAPAKIDTDTRDVPDVAAYTEANDQAAREWGVSYASYDASVLPWRLLRWYNAETGATGTACACPPTT